MERHELLTTFVEDIAASLSAYSLQNGYNDYSYEYYKKMSWAGLTSMESFLSLYPKYIDTNDAVNNITNYNPEWLSIVLTLKSEKYNQPEDFNYQNGTYYEFIPKGTPPNETEPCN